MFQNLHSYLDDADKYKLQMVIHISQTSPFPPGVLSWHMNPPCKSSFCLLINPSFREWLDQADKYTFKLAIICRETPLPPSEGSV